MLDLKYVKENLQFVKEKLAQRGFSFDEQKFLTLDEKRRKIITITEEKRAIRNRVSKEIPQIKKSGKDATALIHEMKKVGDEIKKLEEELQEIEDNFNAIMLRIPNIPDDSVPVGESEEENLELRRWGSPRSFPFTVKDHVDLGRELGILDMDRAAKITGARFAVYKGAGALLERALINLMLHEHTNKHGYKEVLPPFMVNADSLLGTGNLPKFEEDLFRIKGWPFYLIPTAEVPVTNLFRDEILEEKMLPIKYVAYTPCFRSEAGAHGKETRGLIRQHQFNKVELVKFSNPNNSADEHEKLTADAERILQLLMLPYRVVSLCTGDLGFSSAKTYDLEVWLPSREKYVEISSCSNFKDFQARRASIKYRPSGGGKPRYVHTLNGSGLAIGRTWVAVVENYQNEDGTVTIPEILRPFMGGLKKIKPEESF